MSLEVHEDPSLEDAGFEQKLLHVISHASLAAEQGASVARHFDGSLALEHLLDVARLARPGGGLRGLRENGHDVEPHCAPGLVPVLERKMRLGPVHNTC